MNKFFAKKYRKTRPFGFTGKNDYDSKEELQVIVDKGRERQRNKRVIRKEVEEYYSEEEEKLDE